MVIAGVLIAGCLLAQSTIDKVVDNLPSLDHRAEAAIYLGVAIGDIACVILTHNPKGVLEFLSHGEQGAVALYALGVRFHGGALNVGQSPFRGGHGK